MREGKISIFKDGSPDPGPVLVVAPEDVVAMVGALHECMGVMDSLRDYVAEGGSRHMVGATTAIAHSDEAFKKAHAILARLEVEK